MIIYMYLLIDKLHGECDQNAGTGVAKLKKCKGCVVCVWGGGSSVGFDCQPLRLPILNLPM